MRIKDPSGVYQVIETLLKRSATPLTCNDLFDHPDIKLFCQDAGRVSDYLGHMYRRGALSRTPAPKTENSQARWGYFWKVRSSESAQVAIETTEKLTETKKDRSNDDPVSHQVFSKPNISITEDGSSIVIDLPNLTITIRSKN